jgi:hypothetical protein
MCVIFPLNVYEARFSMYFPGNLFASPVEAWKGDVLSSGSAVSADRSCECVARDFVRLGKGYRKQLFHGWRRPCSRGGCPLSCWGAARRGTMDGATCIARSVAACTTVSKDE